MDSEQVNRGHRVSKAGGKVNKKKKEARAKHDEKHGGGYNPRAFTVKSRVKAARAVQRNLDREHHKEKVEHVNKVKETMPPPIVVCVMGPPGVGKTTLIRSLVKKYTRHNVPAPTGPVTVVTGKTRRVTFLEVPNDLNSMIDAAKVADLVLLMIDASYGFEMETFEFLNILQLHGFPKVLGVLTHLDSFKNSKRLRKTKKQLKQRFWTEIYQGAKLFYLSGLVNGKYPKTEIHNLSLFLSRIKFRPLSWRNTHSYILADRYEDITPPSHITDNEKCDRTIVLYGYSRGANLKQGTKVHLTGVGDFFMDEVEPLHDPCPCPQTLQLEAAEAAQASGGNSGGLTGQGAKTISRRLNAKETLLYAPLSDVGNIIYDKDAMYIQLHDVQFSNKDTLEDGDVNGIINGVSHKDDADGKEMNIELPPSEGQSMVKSLQNLGSQVGHMDDALEDASMSLFSNSKPLTKLKSTSTTTTTSASSSSSSSSSTKKRARRPATDEDGDQRMVREVEESDSDSSSDSSDSSDDSEQDQEQDMHDSSDTSSSSSSSTANSNEKWKSGMTERASESFRQRSRGDIMDLIYNDEDANAANEGVYGGGLGDSESDSDEEFFTRIDDESGKSKNNSSSKKKISDSAKAANIALNSRDQSKYVTPSSIVNDWDDITTRESIRNCFVTGNWKDQGSEDEEDFKSDDGEGGMDQNGFEDLEEGVSYGGDGSRKKSSTRAHNNNNNDDDDDDDDDDTFNSSEDENEVR